MPVIWVKEYITVLPEKGQCVEVRSPDFKLNQKEVAVHIGQRFIKDVLCLTVDSAEEVYITDCGQLVFVPGALDDHIVIDVNDEDPVRLTRLISLLLKRR